MGAETQEEVKDKGMEVMPEVLQAMETTEAVVKVGSFLNESGNEYRNSSFLGGYGGGGQGGRGGGNFGGPPPRQGGGGGNFG